MYEEVTFDEIMQRMLSRVDDSFDKREGSIIYDALAPAAAELQTVYFELDRIIQESFADSQSRDYLIRRAAERGLSPKAATRALRKGVFNMDVPVGSRFSLSDLNYVTGEKISDGIFYMTCETPGEIGNLESGILIPIDYIDGLTSAQLTEVIVPGTDDEDTEVFRRRYVESLNAQAFGGNIADYKERIHTIDGVGGVKVVPVWDGPGTVKVIITDSTYSQPTAELLSKVQNEVDPLNGTGTGMGFAPIGHKVTVVPATPAKIDINTALVLSSGWVWEDIEPYVNEAIETYFENLSVGWAGLDAVTVRLSQIETRLLDITGVIDIADTTLNGEPKNLTLEPDQLPEKGEVNVTITN